MKKIIKIIIKIIACIILIGGFYNIVKPKFYQVSATKIDGNDISEYTVFGIITSGLNKSSFSFKINYLYPTCNDCYFEIFKENNNVENVFVLASQKNYISIIEKNSYEGSFIKKMLKNKENLFMYIYKDINKSEVIGTFKITLDER